MQHDTRLHPDRPYNAITGLPPWPGGGGGGGGFLGGPPGPPPPGPPPPSPPPDDDDERQNVTPDGRDYYYGPSGSEWAAVNEAADRALDEVGTLNITTLRALDPDAFERELINLRQRLNQPEPIVTNNGELITDWDSQDYRDDEVMSALTAAGIQLEPGNTGWSDDDSEEEELAPTSKSVRFTRETEDITRTSPRRKGARRNLSNVRPDRDQQLIERQRRDVDRGATWINPVTEQRENAVGRIKFRSNGQAGSSSAYVYSPVPQPNFN